MSKLRNIVVVDVVVVAVFFIDLSLSLPQRFFRYFIKLIIDVECEISLNMNRISFWHLTVDHTFLWSCLCLSLCVCGPEFLLLWLFLIIWLQMIDIT